MKRPESIPIPSNISLTIFEFAGYSLKTRPEAMIYRYRLKGYDERWRTTHSRRVEYPDLPRGSYVFEVQAVDRDLGYSKVPATVALTVRLPYERIGWISALAVALALVVWQTVRVVRRDRRLRDEAEEELQTAHDMQMKLMPQESPTAQGLEIAGRCIPANHVGGDFFQYFEENDELGVCVADVTGHAMEAAIPMVMFSGILDNQIRRGESLEDLLRELNRSLHRTLDDHTFVCLAAGQFSPSTHLFRLANGGCPYPYHFRAATGELAEFQIDAYPLGVRPDTAYRVRETQLHPGDRIVFCSDGIIEADNAAGDQFGFERTAETIEKACKEDLSAEATIDRILEAVSTFKGNTAQSDDMTCVVVKVEAPL